jgi:hypothetical protein
VAVTQDGKSKVIFDHFMQHIGTYELRSCSLNFSNLGWQPQNLQQLELPVSADELHQVILNAPKEKATGPDGYIGMFFSLC